VLPLTQWLLASVGWHGALLTLAAVALVIVPLTAAMVERREAAAHVFQQSAGEAMARRCRTAATCC